MTFRFLHPKSFSALNWWMIEGVSEYKNISERKKSFVVVHTVNPGRNK